MLRPEMWTINVRGDPWKDLSQYDAANPDPWFFQIQPLVIDPLVFDRKPTMNSAVNIKLFPYSDPDNLASSANADPPVRMPRLNLRLTRDRSTFPNLDQFVRANAAMAQRLFLGGDDVVYQRPDDAALRPQVLREISGQPLPQTPFDGNYSWLMTVAPAGSEESSTMFIGDRRLFTVSVAVFYRRKLPLPDSKLDPSTPATERMVAAVPLGGGGVRLEAENPVYLSDIRPNGWLLLCARLPSTQRPVFRWYRIVSIDDEAQPDPVRPNVWQRYIALAGPDLEWDPSSVDTYAILVDDVVGVYEKTIAIDRSE